jgi:hypothetical protein
VVWREFEERAVDRVNSIKETVPQLINISDILFEVDEDALEEMLRIHAAYLRSVTA